jgi:hypothetical protein
MVSGAGTSRAAAASVSPLPTTAKLKAAIHAKNLVRHSTHVTLVVFMEISRSAMRALASLDTGCVHSAGTWHQGLRHSYKRIEEAILARNPRKISVDFFKAMKGPRSFTAEP